MPRSVLSRQDCDARRRADAHRIELMEADPLLGQPLHIRCAVEIVQGVTFGLPRLIGKKWDGGIHDPHVVDQYQDDIRLAMGCFVVPSQGSAGHDNEPTNKQNSLHQSFQDST